MGRILYWLKKVLLWPFRPFTRMARDWLAGFVHTYFYDALDHAKRLNQLLETAPAQIDARVRTVEDLIRTSDEVMLAVVQALPPPTDATAFRCTALGDGWLLAAHPHARFVYLRGDDLVETPRVLVGGFQPGVTAALLRCLQADSVYYDATPGCGYHVLTAATRTKNLHVATLTTTLARNRDAHHLSLTEGLPAKATVVRSVVDATTDFDALLRFPTLILSYDPQTFTPEERGRLLLQLHAVRAVSCYRDGLWDNAEVSLTHLDHVTLLVQPKG